jgi:hypothetical protein
MHHAFLIGILASLYKLFGFDAQGVRELANSARVWLLYPTGFALSGSWSGSGPAFVAAVEERG